MLEKGPKPKPEEISKEIKIGPYTLEVRVNTHSPYYNQDAKDWVIWRNQTVTLVAIDNTSVAINELAREFLPIQISTAIKSFSASNVDIKAMFEEHLKYVQGHGDEFISTDVLRMLMLDSDFLNGSKTSRVVFREDVLNHISRVIKSKNLYFTRLYLDGIEGEYAICAVKEVEKKSLFFKSKVDEYYMLGRISIKDKTNWTLDVYGKNFVIVFIEMFESALKIFNAKLTVTLKEDEPIQFTKENPPEFF